MQPVNILITRPEFKENNIEDLSVLAQVPPCDKIVEWISENVIQGDYFKYGITNESFLQDVVENFHNEFKTLNCDFAQKFKGRIKPYERSDNFFYFFLSMLQEKLNLLKAHCNTHSNLFARWTTFLSGLAYMRYQRCEDITSETTQFIQDLTTELHQIDPNLLDEEESKKLNDLWQHISVAPDLLEIKVQTICSKSNSPIKDLHIIKLDLRSFLVAARDNIQFICSNIHWVTEEIINLLSPIQGGVDLTNQCPKMLREIKKFKGNIIPQLLRLQANHRHITRCLEDYNKLDEYFFDVFKNPDGNRNPCFGNYAENVRNFEATLVNIDFDRILFGRTEDYQYSLDIASDTSSAICTLKRVEANYATLKYHLEALYIKQKCHILLDTYIIMPWSDLKKNLEIIKDWKEDHEHKLNYQRHLKMLDHKQLMFTPSFSCPIVPPAEEQSVDDILAFIGVPNSNTTTQSTKKKPSKPSKPRGRSQADLNGRDKAVTKQAERPGKHKKTTLTKQTRHSTKSLQAASTTTSTNKTLQTNNSALLEITKAESAANGLYSLLLSIDTSYSNHDVRTSLRQAYMHLQDHIMAASALYDSQATHANSLANMVVIISSAYYFMEQALRSQRQQPATDGDLMFHDLKQWFRHIGSPSQLPANAVSELSLGNFWTAYPFEQINLWNDLAARYDKKMPQPLKLLAEALESDNYTKAIPNLKEYFKDTLSFASAFVTQYPVEQVQSFQANATFNGENNFPIKLIDSVIKRCEMLIEALVKTSDHPVIYKIQQAHYNLILLKNACTILSVDVTANSLSVWLRHAIHWQHASMENLLQSLLLIQTGQHSNMHYLDQLYKDIPWSSGSNQAEIDFLHDHWNNVQQFWRYPFEGDSILSPLHELILQAEFLKETDGFKMQSKASHVSTTLNYIAVPHKTLDGPVLLKKLANCMNDATSFLADRLLGELEMVMNDIFLAEKQ